MAGMDSVPEKAETIIHPMSDVFSFVDSVLVMS
jgi:hypothetical protein